MLDLSGPGSDHDGKVLNFTHLSKCRVLKMLKILPSPANFGEETPPSVPTSIFRGKFDVGSSAGLIGKNLVQQRASQHEGVPLSPWTLD